MGFGVVVGYDELVKFLFDDSPKSFAGAGCRSASGSDTPSGSKWRTAKASNSPVPMDKPIVAQHNSIKYRISKHTSVGILAAPRKAAGSGRAPVSTMGPA
jgi:hypothetical protein